MIILIISNILFYLLFGNETKTETASIPAGWVEIKIKAELLTPFQMGKKVLLIQRQRRKQIEAMLEMQPTDPEDRFTVWVKESEAEGLLRFENWEIIPFIKTLSLEPSNKGITHEINY
jgi:hypothetical protein